MTSTKRATGKTAGAERIDDWRAYGSPSAGVCAALAAVTGAPPSRADLERAVDPDVLDAFLASSEASPLDEKCLRFAYEGAAVAVAADGTVRVWELDE